MASVGRPGAASLEDVLQRELQRIRTSRQARLAKGGEEVTGGEQPLVGLALSGGGARSATFGLGVLQGLAQSDLLSRIDYLSSTGGGSYIAGFLSAWIHSSGYHEVEAQLRGKKSSTDPPEIQELRQSTVSILGRGVSGSSSVVTAWIRNLAVNLISMAALLGALLLLTHLVLAGIWRAPYPEALASCLAGMAAGMLAILSRRSEHSALGRKARPWRLLTVVSTLAACALFSVVMAHRVKPMPSDSGPGTWWQNWLAIGGVIAAYCFLAWFPRKGTLTTLSAHTASATLAGVAGGLPLSPSPWLLSRLSIWVSAKFGSLKGSTVVIELATPPIVVSLVMAVLLYMFLMGPWISKRVRELCWWLCRSLLYISAVWLLVALVWSLHTDTISVFSVLGVLAVAIASIVGGLLSSVGALTLRRSLQVVFDLLERIAPFLFVLTLAVAVGAPLTRLVRPEQIITETLVGTGLLILGVFLLRRTAANELTLHGFQRERLAQSYLASAEVGRRDRTGRMDESEPRLADLTGPPETVGPYPLFGATVDGVESDSSGPPQTRKAPFILSPLFSGFDPIQSREQKGAYRPTARFSGGVSLSTAMALSGPLRESTRQPASAAISMLWTIFDLHDGRWMGNPLREDTWSKPGPFLGAAYALGEGFSRLDSEAAFLRPSGGPVFDNLGLYQLVKRRCRLIIACDASTDPTYTFTDLSVAIRRCRTELGVDIEMDLGPLVRRGTVTGTHGQIAVIHYPDGEPGWMLYLKPSFTGDEPADLVQYAAAHPDFPATDAAPGSFDEADFELYRRLGRHIVESLLAQVESPAELPVEQIFRAIRRRLQPDFKESETLSDPSTAQPPEAPPQELIDIIASRECLLWSGPGLAAQAKSPTWPSFLEGLLHVAREAGALDPVAASGLAATLAAGELEAAADELTHQVPREMLLEYVGAATSVSDPSPAHQLLAKMPFLGVLNTSFDELLASAFGSPTLVPAQTEKLIRALRTKSFFVTNVLGSASQPSSLLFTLKELRMLLAANLHFKQFLSTFFLRYNVLFVGSSIDGLRAYLEVLELPQTPERRHYALVASAGPLDPVKLRFLERSYNLHILEYPPGFNFAGLPAFLKRLQSSVSEKVPPARPEGARVLKSVTLENIGPFDSLRLELTPTWNLLLGDNGVGKTVVLRAIAAALCGDEADSEAVARLLRSGTDSGSILLAVEGREYKVELKRDPDGKVRIVAASLSPINYDRWLVLGFPALRSIPWDRPKGPSAPGPEAPSADDLLPILRSVPDERIADIKQWLINLDYAAGSEPEPSRSKALLDGFFEILQKLTPDLRIKLHSIDKKTMEITLETDSGLVPLEAISQGTGSVLCWIGTLLERLSEAGSEGAALVLIDEIDAHMHPKWQQLFVGAFRDQFKEVQVIATTHSPLLVGSLKPEEIWLVHRAPLRSEIYGVVHLETTDEGAGQEIVILGPEDDPDEGQPPAPREERRYRLPVGAELLVKEGEVVEDREPLTTKRVVVAERMPFGPEGFRVDQILTSPLFNLETTRDPDTSALMNEYSRLVAFENPTEDDRRALARVAGQLQIRVATPQEQETARLAFGLIQDFANERLRSLPPEERQKVLAEVKVQMTESITGSWRPE